MSAPTTKLRAVRSAHVPEGTPPPHDLDAEAAVISAALIAGNVDTVGDLVGPEMFYAGRHQTIWRAILDVDAAKKPIDLVTVATRLRDAQRLDGVGGLAYLTEILNCAPAVANVRAYASTVRERWRMRELAHACERIRAEVYAREHETAQELFESAEQRIGAITASPETSTIEHAGAVAKRMVEAVKHAGSAGIAGTSSGFAALDGVTGGLVPGEVTVVGARPGMGKSALALNVATNVAGALDAHGEGQGVVFFGMEMPRIQVARRAACSLGSVCVARAKSGQLSPSEWSRLVEGAERLDRMPLYFDDQPGLTVFQLRAKIRQTRAAMAQRTPAARLRLVVVDYLQLLRASPEATKHGREVAVSENARGLKGLALEEGVAIVALVQLKRDIDNRADKRPTIADCRESGEIEQAADNIALIFRADYYARRSWRGPGPFVGDNVAEVNFAKIRDGEPGLVTMHFVDAFTRFEDRTP